MEQIFPEELIRQVREHGMAQAADVLSLTAYVHNGEDGWDASDDIHAVFREQVAEVLYKDFSIADKDLVTYLLQEERRFCVAETLMTDTLRRLSFMLYLAGDVTDIPLLFAAKFATSFDAMCGLDVELIFGKNREETIAYYTTHPHPDYDIVAAINERDSNDYSSPDEFIAGMRYYFAD